MGISPLPEYHPVLGGNRNGLGRFWSSEADRSSESRPHLGRMSVLNRWRRLCSAALTLCLGMTLSTGCAPTPLSRFPDFPKMKPTLGTLAVLVDVTSLVYAPGDIEKLDILGSEQLGTVFVSEMASALKQKGYVVGKSVHATIGWLLRPGTQVYAIRSIEDRDRDPLPLAETPIYMSQELAADPALKQAWETLGSTLRLPTKTDVDAGAALSRLGQAFSADTIVLVIVGVRKVPLGTELGRGMLNRLTLGHTSAPASSGVHAMIFADTRSGRILWRDEGPGGPVNERGVKNIVQWLVRPLP